MATLHHEHRALSRSLLSVSRSLVVLGILVCLCSTGLEAQGRAGVRGTVVDETGLAIPRADVTLIDLAGGTTTRTKTDGSGRFALEDVRPGEYLLHVTAAEFQDVDLPVTVGRDALKPLTVTMRVGLEEEVTVVGSRRDSPVRADQNADAITFNRDFLAQLPVDGNDVLPLLSSLLAPSAAGVDGLSIIIDGVEGSTLDLSAAAIRHVTVNRNPYSSEFRRPGKARVEVVTEHGSRKFHGSGAFSGRASLFDARNPFAQTKPPENKGLLNGSFGGPLHRDRSTFFLTGSWLNHDESAVVHARTLAGAGPVVENVAAPREHANWYGRVDARPNRSHALIGRYDFTGDTARNRGVGGLHLTEQGYDTEEHKHTLQLGSHDLFAPVSNDVRIQAAWQHKRAGQPSDRPAMVVHGAFTGGASQTYHVNDDTDVHVQDVATYFHGPHTVRFGGEARAKRVHVVDASNFGGTFEFAGLNQLARGTPILFRINRGTPDIDFSQHEAFGFVQDEVRVRSDLSVMAGVREDWQARPGAGASLAPRAAVTWAPGVQKTVLRAGAGMFYDRLPDAAIVRASLFDGQRLREFVMIAPAFPDPFASDQGVLPPSNVTRVESDVHAPALLQASVGVERALWQNSRVVIEYQALRGWHQFRARNLNAPSDPFGPRPDPALLNVALVGSAGAMRSDALAISFNGQITRQFLGVVHYTWSKATDESSGLFDLPADPRNVAAERGRADHDRRHRVNVVGTWQAGHGLKVGVLASLATGSPFDITTGFDDNGDGRVHDRPIGVTRNTGEGSGLAQMDLRVTKLLALRPASTHPDKHGMIEVALDAFNAFNRSNFTNFIGIQTSPFFGDATAARAARTVQASVKYRF